MCDQNYAPTQLPLFADANQRFYNVLGQPTDAPAITVKQFGAVGDGATDDTAAIQSALNSSTQGIVFFPAGVYRIGSTLTIPDNRYLLGCGRSASVLRALPSLPSNRRLLQGSSLVNPNGNIVFQGLGIDGNNNDRTQPQTRLTEFCGFYLADRVTFRDCLVQNCAYIALGFAGCSRVLVDGCTFQNVGFPFPLISTTGGQGVWVGNSGGTRSSYITVVNNYATQCYWHPFAINKADKVVVSHNTLYNNGEGGLYSSGGNDWVVSDNVIDGITTTNVSGHGIEVAAVNRAVIADNSIVNVSQAGVAITDCIDLQCTSNAIGNFNQDGNIGGGVYLLQVSGSGQVGTNVIVADNQFYDDQNTPTGYAPIQIFRQNVGGTVLNNLVIKGNVAWPVAWRGTATINLLSSPLGTNVQIYSNPGFKENVSTATGSVQLPGSTGSFSVTGVGFRPSTLRIRVQGTGTNLRRSEALVSNQNLLFITLQSFAVDISGTQSVILTNSNCINIIDGAGTVLYRATFTSFDADGFTINVTTASVTPFMMWDAFR